MSENTDRESDHVGAGQYTITYIKYMLNHIYFIIFTAGRQYGVKKVYNYHISDFACELIRGCRNLRQPRAVMHVLMNDGLTKTF